MKRILIFLVIAFTSTHTFIYASDINRYYKYGEFNKYIRYALKKKNNSLYGKIGKSYFFTGDYKKAMKYLSLAYEKTGDIDLINFYTKCKIKLDDSVSIKNRIKSYIVKDNYDTLTLGFFYSLHTENTMLSDYVDSIHLKFPSTKLSYVAEKNLLYNGLSSVSAENNPDSFLLNFLSRYQDTYIYNEALIIYDKYLFKSKKRKQIHNILHDSLASIETKSIVIESLLDLNYSRKKMNKILISGLKDSLKKPDFTDKNEWNMRKRQTTIRLKLDLARLFLKRGYAKKALYYLDEAEAYTLPYLPKMTYRQSVDYYKSIACLKSGKYKDARITISNGLICGGKYDTKLKKLYKRNFPGSPLTYAKKLNDYHGPVFRNATRTKGLKDIKGYRIAAGDINSDGYPDLLIDGRLFLNKRGLKFIDVTERVGLETDYSDHFFFTDFNNDGREDILLANHKNGITIYENDDNGVFRIVWKDSSIKNYSMIAPVNYNNDHYPDILITSADSTREKLTILINNDSFHFRQKEYPFPNADKVSGISVFDNFVYVAMSNLTKNSMITFNRNSIKDYATSLHVAGINHDGWWGGPFSGDINNDGKIDLVSCNTNTPENISNCDMTNIYLRGKDNYKDIFSKTGIPYDNDNINPILGDFNNDGYDDLFVTSRKNSHIYLNNGNGTFSDITYLSGARISNSYGAISIDFDRDGDQDLILCSPEGVQLLENIRKNTNTYFNLQIIGTKSGSDAFGTKAILYFNDFKITKFIHTIDGIGNQTDRILHFGLNLDYGPIRKVKIIFPSGKVTYLYNVKRGGILKIHE
ncbi:MAG: hypothetical protein GWP03_06140 [Proteobacteria bacterium]|nr:hypothetical protein [Pseudomonadota bacterium]